MRGVRDHPGGLPEGGAEGSYWQVLSLNDSHQIFWKDRRRKQSQFRERRVQPSQTPLLTPHTSQHTCSYVPSECFLAPRATTGQMLKEVLLL